MTRINLVPVSELTDQHLFAEFREIKHVPHSLAHSLKARGLEGVLATIPKEFTLGRGHVTFFYDKGYYLCKRYLQIAGELLERGYNLDVAFDHYPSKVFGLYDTLCNDYQPTPEALSLIRNRIAEKIALKPHWYRMHGKPLI